MLKNDDARLSDDLSQVMEIFSHCDETDPYLESENVVFLLESDLWMLMEIASFSFSLEYAPYVEFVLFPLEVLSPASLLGGVPSSIAANGGGTSFTGVGVLDRLAGVLSLDLPGTSSGALS